jgi:hypothetical protein
VEGTGYTTLCAATKGAGVGITLTLNPNPEPNPNANNNTDPNPNPDPVAPQQSVWKMQVAPGAVLRKKKLHPAGLGLELALGLGFLSVRGGGAGHTRRCAAVQRLNEVASRRRKLACGGGGASRPNVSPALAATAAAAVASIVAGGDTWVVTVGKP